MRVSKHGTSDGKCGHVFYYANMFSHHLKNVHSMSREKREELKQHCRIGRSGHTRFWCGFCKDIIPVSGARGQAAWDERFNHIDERHYKQEQRIDDWLCIETRVTKGEQEGLKKQPILHEAELPEDRNVPDDISDEDGPTFNGPPVMDSPPDTPPREAAEPSSVMQNGVTQVPQFSDDQEADGIYCVSDSDLGIQLLVANTGTVPMQDGPIRGILWSVWNHGRGLRPSVL